MRTDIEKALEEAKAKRMINPLGIKGQLKLLENHLSADEEVLKLNTANLNLITKSENLKNKPFDLSNKKPGLFVITSKRVIHLSKILFNESFEQIMIKDINNVEYKSHLLGSTLRIQSITNVLEIDLKSKVVKEYVSFLNDLRNMNNKDIPKDNDITEKIKKLAALHADGILTDEEFERKKKELLDKI